MAVESFKLLVVMITWGSNGGMGTATAMEVIEFHDRSAAEIAFQNITSLPGIRIVRLY